MNAVLARLSGYTDATLLNRGLACLAGAATDLAAQAAVESAIATGTELHSEICWSRADGSAFWFGFARPLDRSSPGAALLSWSNIDRPLRAFPAPGAAVVELEAASASLLPVLNPLTAIEERPIWLLRQGKDNRTPQATRAQVSLSRLRASRRRSSPSFDWRIPVPRGPKSGERSTTSGLEEAAPMMNAAAGFHRDDPRIEAVDCGDQLCPAGPVRDGNAVVIDPENVERVLADVDCERVRGY